MACAKPGSAHELIVAIAPAHIVEVVPGQRRVAIRALEQEEALRRAELPRRRRIGGEIEEDLFDADATEGAADDGTGEARRRRLVAQASLVDRDVTLRVGAQVEASGGERRTGCGPDGEVGVERRDRHAPARRVIRVEGQRAAAKGLPRSVHAAQAHGAKIPALGHQIDVQSAAEEVVEEAGRVPHGARQQDVGDRVVGVRVQRKLRPLLIRFEVLVPERTARHPDVLDHLSGQRVGEVAKEEPHATGERVSAESRSRELEVLGPIGPGLADRLWEPTTGVAEKGEGPQVGPGREEVAARKLRQTCAAHIGTVILIALKSHRTIPREHQGHNAAAAVGPIRRALLDIGFVPASIARDESEKRAITPRVRVVPRMLWLGHVLERVSPFPSPAIFQLWALVTLIGWYDRYVDPP